MTYEDELIAMIHGKEQNRPERTKGDASESRKAREGTTETVRLSS